MEHDSSEITPLNQENNQLEIYENEEEQEAHCSNYSFNENPTPPPSPELEPECYLCGNQRYTNSNALPHQKRYVKPCECESKYSHHGCLLVLFPNGMECSKCLTKYRYYVYGSYSDFLRRYWYQFVAVFLSCTLLTSFGFYCIYLGLDGERFKNLVLLSLGTAAFTFSLFLLVKFLLVKFCRHYPKFKKRYGNVMIFDYCRADKKKIPKTTTEVENIYYHLASPNALKKREKFSVVKENVSFESLGSFHSFSEEPKMDEDNLSYTSEDSTGSPLPSIK